MLGSWALAEPAALTLSATSASLGQSCLQAAAHSGRLCLDGAWQASGAAALQLALSTLPVSSLSPATTGELSGTLQADVGAAGEVRAEGRFALSPGEIVLPPELGSRALPHGGGELALSATDGGLAAKLDFAAPEQGELAAQLRIPGASTLPLAEDAPLEGSVHAALPDLAIISALLSDVSGTAGSLLADITLGGTLSAPELGGELRLSEASAQVPVAGVRLEQIELLAQGEPGKPGVLRIDGGFNSGGERLALKGSVDVPAGSAQLRLKGERVLVFDTEDARALVSPDLRVGFAEGVLDLSGVVEIPRARITPRLRLGGSEDADPATAARIPGAAITPSADVVILGEEPTATELQATLDAPLGIRANVALLMGDRVEVNAIGLISRITGGVNFRLDPAQRELIPMAQGMISLKDGTFRSFGQDLDIETGQLIFANVPADEPELFLRAVRWIDNDPEVTAAGILLSGPATQPTLELFSRPQLAPAEVQSYLLTGTATGRRRSTVGIGTYLSERLYVGYGYNLLEETSEFDALFSITPRYGLGVDAGEADSNFNLTFSIER